MQKLNAYKIIAALEKGGAIARQLPAYENRKAQLDLMKLIIQGFNEDALVAAEAGTGVGKSFAYLLPALSYAALNNERIVISTATITLQQQLYEKDIPLVLAGLQRNVKVALVKGRGNYLCFRRLEEALREEFLFAEKEYEELKKIAAWSQTTADGCRSDLQFMPTESLWSRVCSEADACMGGRCPEAGRCFVLALRRACNEAQILVVNHHLLFADLAARREGAGYDSTVVLPAYTRVIIDEAHTIEASATSFFSEEFSRLGLYRQVGRLYRMSRGNRIGLLVRILPAFTEEADMAELDAAVQRIRTDAEALDAAAIGLCASDGFFRLTPQREKGFKKTLPTALGNLKKSLDDLSTIVKKILEKIPEKAQDDVTVWEVRAILRRFDTVSKICASFIDFKNRPEDVLWIECRGGAAGEPWAAFRITPIDVAAPLKEALFEPNQTVICVSATLTIKDSFEFWKTRSGIGAAAPNRKILTGQFPSPFPYASAVFLAIPQDAPLPGARDYRDFVDTAAAALALKAGGSALVLFTSYNALQSAYTAAAPLLEKEGIRCLKQGDDDRNRLLQQFLEDERSVLFGTDSFWEGVDAPGETLRMVILCRLPFKAPNDPVFEARCEAIDRNGGNSFMELSLPESVVKFKQGFGRLMRRSSDHGVVAVLDGRVLHKRYGEYFLHSLPKTLASCSLFETLLQEITTFLAS